MRRDLRKRRLLITGASGGIGSSLARQASAAGARLLLTARSSEAVHALADELNAAGGDAIAMPADITSDTDRHRLMNAAVERFDGLDALINNAGIGSFGHFVDGSEEELRQIMEVNFFAPAELIRLAIPILSRGTQPAIVNVASMCGRRGMPAWSEYSASKYALCGLTEALRGEMVRFDIDVLLIVPGLTRSDFARHMLRHAGKAKIPFERGMPVEDVARAILKALVRNRTETVLGTDARWILRIGRFFPRILDALLARKVRQLYADEKSQVEAVSH
jgi:short-subunit dehydrogenase